MKRQKYKRRRRRLLALVEQQDGKCALCGKPFTGFQVPTLDHIRPLSHGGSNDLSNLQAAHGPCNEEKADRCPGCPQCFGLVYE